MNKGGTLIYIVAAILLIVWIVVIVLSVRRVLRRGTKRDNPGNKQQIQG